jgi:hypothetical protein
MDNHSQTFFAGRHYADRFAVTSAGVHSGPPEARLLEEQLKRHRPEFSEVWPQIEVLPEAERNFLAAVFIAWTPEHSFYIALKSGLMPAALQLSEESGDYEFGDHYLTYEWDAATYRKIALEEKLEGHQRQVKNLADQLLRMSVRVADTVE